VDFRFTILDVAVMLVIIVPTAIMTTVFLLRYRKTNAKAAYDPKWSHSNLIEFVVWTIPIAIVAMLGYYSYQGTFAVNPYNPRLINSASTASGKKAPRPLDVDVITTDWQWLFIYPKQDIATANELVIPVGTPIHFRLTSATVVNDFYIPKLAGMIDIMPGMRTKQVLLADRIGKYQGYSANFSGGGFSWMGFKTKVVAQNQFQTWAKRVAKSPQRLNYARFNAFAKPYKNVDGKTDQFSHVSAGLFDRVIKAITMGKVYKTPLPTYGKA
jgi:cytochrome o ubiquinol oxidase subunit 2